MEINITWNVCRLCLREHNMPACTTVEEISEEIILQIHELTGVMIRSNDSLPQKICKKCLQKLKQAVHFRTTCRCSDTYLQNILEKAKSTTSLFRLDKPNKITFGNNENNDDDNHYNDEDVIEDVSEDIFDEEQIFDGCVPKMKRKNVEEENTKYTETLYPEKRRKNHNDLTKNVISCEKDQTESELECDNECTPVIEDENNFHMRPLKLELSSKISNQEDFASIFLNKDASDDDETTEKFIGSPTEDSKTIKRSNKYKHTTHSNESQRDNFLEYKNLNVTLDSNVEEDDVQDDELLQSHNLSTVDLSNNDDNHELFFIYSDDLISKQNDNDTSTDNNQNLKENTILVGDMSDIIDNIPENSDDERNFDEIVDSESNTFDQIDCIDDDLIKCEGVSSDNFIERTTMYIEETSDNFDRTNEDRFILQKMKKHKCQLCSNLFCSQVLLKQHMRTDHNKRNFECELCGKRFTAACNLTTHMRTHTGEKPFVCHFCERRFSDKSTHVKHERSHTDERPYSCSICQKAFTLSSSLKAHKRVHTGEKPFTCYTCGKSFKLPHQLKAHFSTNAHKIRAEVEFITPN